MLCSEIITQIEKTYPKEAALGFDNVGFLAGRGEKEVKRILLALDATDKVVEKAVQVKADLLITHHPLIFSAMKSVTDQDFIGRRVLKLTDIRRESGGSEEYRAERLWKNAAVM